MRILWILGISITLLGLFSGCTTTKEWASAQYDSLIQDSRLPKLRLARNRALKEIAVEEEAFNRLEDTGSLAEGSNERFKAVSIRAQKFYGELGPVVDAYFEYNNSILSEITNAETSSEDRNELTKELETVRKDLKELLLAVVEINDSVAENKEQAYKVGFPWSVKLPKMKAAPENVLLARDILDIQGFDW